MVPSSRAPAAALQGCVVSPSSLAPQGVFCHPLWRRMPAWRGGWFVGPQPPDPGQRVADPPVQSGIGSLELALQGFRQGQIVSVIRLGLTEAQRKGQGPFV